MGEPGQRPHNPFLVDGDRSRVDTPGRVAWRVAPTLVRMAAEARDGGQRIDEDVIEWIRAMQQAAMDYHRDDLAGRSDNGTSEYRPKLPPARLPHALDTKQVAERLGITTRAVIGLATRGTLPSLKVAGRWTFDHEDVRAYQERRDDERTT